MRAQPCRSYDRKGKQKFITTPLPWHHLEQLSSEALRGDDRVRSKFDMALLAVANDSSNCAVRQPPFVLTRSWSPIASAFATSSYHFAFARSRALINACCRKSWTWPCAVCLKTVIEAWFGIFWYSQAQNRSITQLPSVNSMI